MAKNAWLKNFNRVEHQMSDFEFTVIEKIVNECEDHIDRRLLTREAFWCSQLCTLHPHGLNKRSEFNSKNRIELGLANKFYVFFSYSLAFDS